MWIKKEPQLSFEICNHFTSVFLLTISQECCQQRLRQHYSLIYSGTQVLARIPCSYGAYVHLGVNKPNCKHAISKFHNRNRGKMHARVGWLKLLCSIMFGILFFLWVSNMTVGVYVLCLCPVSSWWPILDVSSQESLRASQRLTPVTSDLSVVLAAVFLGLYLHRGGLTTRCPAWHVQHVNISTNNQAY